MDATAERASSRRRHVALFVVLAYALTWAFWIPEILDVPASGWLHYLGGLGPMTAALVVTARRGGRPAVRALVGSMTRWRSPWVALAVGLPLGLFIVGAGVSAITGSPVDLGGFLGSEQLPEVGAAIILLELICFGYGEETGWRGFLLPALEESGRTPYRAAAIVAVIWSGWHLPAFFGSSSVGSLSPAMALGWLASLTLASFFAAWLFHSAGGSVLVVALFHGTFDVVSISPAATDTVLVVVSAGLMTAAVLVLTRSKVLHRPVPQQVASPVGAR